MNTNYTRSECESEINACKQILASLDYQALKYAEGALTEQEYAETKAKRQHLRDKINENEEILASLPIEEEPEYQVGEDTTEEA